MADLRRRVGPGTWIVRAISAAMVVVGVTAAWQRFRPSPEQEELTRYVQFQVPSFVEKEAAIYERIDRLSAQPGPTPAEARTLLVDDVMPRLVALRKQAGDVQARSDALRRVNAEYLSALDLLIEACRASVRAIDAPPTPSSIRRDGGTVETEQREASRDVMARFRAAGQAERAWSAHLRDACVAARLAPPGARP